MIATTEAPSRVCRECLQSKPETDFRRHRAGSTVRETQCRQCHSDAEKSRRQARRGRALDRFATRIVEAKTFGRLNLLAGRMLGAFGGVERLGRAWGQHVKLLTEQRPGSRAACSHLFAIVTMLRQCEEEKRRQPTGQLPVEDAVEVLALLFQAGLAENHGEPKNTSRPT